MKHQIKPTKKGADIQDHLSGINLDAWFFIYENHVRKESKENKSS